MFYHASAYFSRGIFGRLLGIFLVEGRRGGGGRGLRLFPTHGIICQFLEHAFDTAGKKDTLDISYSALGRLQRIDALHRVEPYFPHLPSESPTRHLYRR